uniref:Uncharacterized protein n=1 Tax=Nothoprocta perdicaria TaxID=30464 RepID=A0A8C6YZ26_NOTPE
AAPTTARSFQGNPEQAPSKPVRPPWFPLPRRPLCPGADQGGRKSLALPVGSGLQGLARRAQAATPHALWGHAGTQAPLPPLLAPNISLEEPIKGISAPRRPFPPALVCLLLRRAPNSSALPGALAVPPGSSSPPSVFQAQVGEFVPFRLSFFKVSSAFLLEKVS